MNYIDYKELAREARHSFEQKQERLEDEANELRGCMQIMSAFEDVLVQLREKEENEASYKAELDKLNEENEDLRNDNQKLAEEKEQLEMKLKELQKLIDGVAKKSSQEEVIKAIRTFVNNSKRKKIDKRAAAKEMVLEFINANRIDVPQDLMDVILSLDDEQPEVKVVNVSGNYNDVHDNGKVNIKAEG